MGFAFSKNFPIIEVMFSNSPIAVFITKGPKVELLKIKPILDKCFVCKYGWFYLDPHMKIPIGRTFLYFYSGHNINPISIPAIKEIELYLSKVDKHDLGPLDMWVEQQFEEQAKTDRKVLEEPGDHQLLEPQPEQPQQEKKEANPMQDMIGEYEQQQQEEPEPEQEPEPRIEMVLKRMRSPVNVFVERFLSGYGQSNPGAYRLAMKEVKMAKKQLDSMESKTMKSVIPLGVIAAVMIGVVLLMSNINTIAENLDGLVGKFSPDNGGAVLPTIDVPTLVPPPDVVTGSTTITKLIAYLGGVI